MTPAERSGYRAPMNHNRAPRSGPPRIQVQECRGDLLGQLDIEALVNPRNRNFVPRWLLQPGGISKQLEAQTGPEPWTELAAHGTLALD
jgi:hypothetical protein